MTQVGSQRRFLSWCLLLEIFYLVFSGEGNRLPSENSTTKKEKLFSTLCFQNRLYGGALFSKGVDRREGSSEKKSVQTFPEQPITKSTPSEELHEQVFTNRPLPNLEGKPLPRWWGKSLLPQNSVEDKAKLYKNLFNAPAPDMPEAIPTLVLINGEVQNPIYITYNREGTNFTFPSQDLLPALKDFLNEKHFARVKNQESSKSLLDLKALLLCDFAISYRYSPSILFIDIDFEKIGTRHHFVSGVKPIDLKGSDITQPATVSAFINYRFDQVYSWPKPDHVGTRDPLSGSFEAAFNLQKKVLEGSFQYIEKALHPFKRKETHLVVDLPENNRLIVGDLSYVTTRNQSFIELGGVSLSKNCSSLPKSRGSLSEHWECILEKETDVEIWINQILAQKMTLKAGTHVFSEFAFVDGANRVEIKFTDVDRKAWSVDLEYIKDPSLINEGEVQYSFDFGFPSLPQGADKRYNPSYPVANLFYCKGVQKNVTASAYLQTDSHQSILGLGCASVFTKIKTECAFDFSSINGGKSGSALQITLSPFLAAFKNRWSGWRFFALYNGRYFARLGNLKPNNCQKYNLGTSLQFRLPFSFGLGVGASYSFNRSGYTNSASCSGSLSRSFGQYCQFSVGIQRAKSSRGIYSKTWFAGVSFAAESKDFALTGSYLINNENRFLDFQGSYIPENVSPIARPKIYSNLSTDKESKSYQVTSMYNSNKAAVELSHTICKFTDTSQPTTFATELLVSGAIVTAEGSFALSNTVRSGGFVLVKGIKNLEKSRIEIDPSEKGPRAVNSFFGGPAVHPSLSPYSINYMSLDIPNMPVNYIFKQNRFKIYPSYKQGYLIFMGEEPTKTLEGTLLFSSKEPIAHAMLLVTSLDNPTSKPFQVLTGSRGKFQVMGLKSGRYSIKVYTKESKGLDLFEIVIPSNKEEIISLGEKELE